MGYFVTFEGNEGCGKTTQIRLLAEELTGKGYACIVTREPGGCPIADQIRRVLLDADNSAMVPMAELLLYAAARAQHVTEVIAPALASGQVVLCDRFTDATVAYQGYGRGLDLGILDQLNRFATENIRPDLTILLDCPVEVGLNRANTRISNCRGDKEERFELESLLFHERVRDGYLQIAEQEPERVIMIDGHQNIEDTGKAILAAVLARLTAV